MIYLSYSVLLDCVLQCVLYSVFCVLVGMSSTASVWCRSMHSMQSIVEYINKESTNRALLERQINESHRPPTPPPQRSGRAK